MRSTVKKSISILLTVVFIMICVNAVTMQTAEAASYPCFENPIDGYEYSTFGTGVSSVQVRITPCLVMVVGAATRHLFVRTSVNGEVLSFEMYNVNSAGLIKYSLNLDYFGTYKMECMLDIPDTTNGITYHVFDESQFVPDATITFTNIHKGHIEPDDYTIDKEATCTEKGSKSKHCTRCGEIIPETVTEIPALGHKWGTPSYTWSSDNSSVKASATCENDSSHEEIESVTTTHKVTVEPTTTSEGKAVYTATFTKAPFTTQTKEVTIPKLHSSSDDDSGDGSGGGSNPGTGSDPGDGTNPGAGSEPGTDSSDPGTSTDPGTGSDPATGSESDSGIQEIVTLKKIKISKASAISKKKIKVSWKKLSKKVRKTARNIQVQVSTDKSFGDIVAEKILKNTKTSVSISGLKKNTKYYVRIRVFTEDGKIRYVSPWSSVKKVKTKKK